MQGDAWEVASACLSCLGAAYISYSGEVLRLYFLQLFRTDCYLVLQLCLKSVMCVLLSQGSRDGKKRIMVSCVTKNIEDKIR